MMSPCLLIPLQAAMLRINLRSSGVQRNAIVLLCLRALFSHGILFTPPPRSVERGGHLVLLRGEQMRVTVGDVRRLMSHALGDDS